MLWSINGRRDIFRPCLQACQIYSSSCVPGRCSPSRLREIRTICIVTGNMPGAKPRQDIQQPPLRLPNCLCTPACTCLLQLQALKVAPRDRVGLLLWQDLSSSGCTQACHVRSWLHAQTASGSTRWQALSYRMLNGPAMITLSLHDRCTAHCRQRIAQHRYRGWPLPGKAEYWIP